MYIPADIPSIASDIMNDILTGISVAKCDPTHAQRFGPCGRHGINKIASERHTCAVLDKGAGDRGHFIRRNKWEAMCNGEMGEAEHRGVHDRAAGGVAMAAS